MPRMILWLALGAQCALAFVPDAPYYRRGAMPLWPDGVAPPVDPDSDESHVGKGPVVPTENGPVQGVLRGILRKTIAWWGIPFAEPPIDDLRLKAPQPLQRVWTKPLQASKIPNSCETSEDCLYLNVFASESVLANGSAPRPVMYWIYGGGFNSGNSYEFGLYDGQHLSEKHNVVVVTVNYRLGNLGFMALDALRQEDPHGSTGNYGVQDQSMGLHWVQKNIASFGGDPSRVTIFGESAGGMSVMWHLVSPLSRGLFQGAIMESGTSQASFFFQPLKDALGYGEDTASIVKCPATLGASAQLKCLRSLPRETIQHGAGSDFSVDKRKFEYNSQLNGPHPSDHSPLYPIMPVGPVIDGTSVGTVDVPMRLVEAGRFNKVPLILGANEDGGTVFEPMLPQVVPGGKWPASIFKSTVQLAFDYLFQANSSRFQALYNTTEFKSASWPEDSLISRAIRDVIFMCPLRQMATAYARQGLPAYMYVFHFNYGFLVDNVLHLGDFHAGELPFVFRNWLWAAQAIDRKQDQQLMADIMSCKWATFAYTHDPNGGDRESDWPPGCEIVNKKYSSWPVFSARDRLYYSLKQEPEVRQIRSDNVYPDDLYPRDPKCDLIDELSQYIAFRHDGKPFVDSPVVV